MEITLDALLLGKPTVIKDKNYLATKDYVSDFISFMKKFTQKFIVQVQMPSQYTVSSNGKDLTYNKVWIQAILPNKIEQYNETIGLIYSLDVKTPVYKLYRAYIDMETHNLMVFDQNWLIVKTIEENKKFELPIKELMSLSSGFSDVLSKIKKRFVSQEIKDNHTFLGQLVEKSLLYEYQTVGGKIKLSSSEVIKAFESIFHDTSSTYYLNNQMCSIEHYYNALSAQITNSKDITTRFEKTMLISMLFDISNYDQS